MRALRRDAVRPARAGADVSAVYTVRCDIKDCLEVFNPIAEAASRYSLESCRASSRARGWTTLMRADNVYDLCPQHKGEKLPKVKP